MRFLIWRVASGLAVAVLIRACQTHFYVRKHILSPRVKRFFVTKLATFGARLKWVRTKYLLSLQEFAVRCGIGRSYVSKLEHGQSENPSDELVDRICKTFGVSRAWLQSGEGKPFDAEDLNERAEKGPLLLPSDHPQIIPEKDADAILSLIEEVLAYHTTEGISQMLRNITHKPTLSPALHLRLVSRLVDLLNERLMEGKKPKRWKQ
jgi:transcriptional regulator with XRE-family HTH domain